MTVKEPVLVVGIGASAGGINAIRDVLEKAQCNKSLAFVLVPHVARDYQSKMPELLSKTTEMPWEVIGNDVKIEPCKVYLIPSNNWVEVQKGRFKLIDRPPRGVNQSADVLMRSLAREYKKQAIGVVLSGAVVGQDGTEGVKAIREAGGITIAQDPDTAEFRGMPESAIASGCVEHVFAPEDIGKFLSALSFEADAIASSN